MRCPFCRTSTFRSVTAGENEIDRCTSCGALWFDYGEIRTLTEGKLPPGAQGEAPPSPPDNHAEKPGEALSRMRKEAASLVCPRCAAPLTAIDFQATGIHVFHCASCEGILAPGASAAGIEARFRFLREHGEMYAALGETLARKEKGRMETRYGSSGPAGNMQVPLPVVVPLDDDAPPLRSFPIVTISLIGLAATLYILGQLRGAQLALPGGLPGLPAGTGFAGVPKVSVLIAPFLHSGILPLAAGSLFLFVLGDNVEDRMGSVAYFFFFLFCGICAGIAHVMFGKPGGAPALTSPGAVAGILGAYLVFFPHVSIRLYGMGRIVTLPAYLFACIWVVAVFFLEWRTSPLAAILFPSALSLAGNLAGFGSGVAGAVILRLFEDSRMNCRQE
ncbi:MAG: rhomboid family intramembrane serine protease [Deltaproteobacteria bacterium]